MAQSPYLVTIALGECSVISPRIQAVSVATAIRVVREPGRPGIATDQQQSERIHADVAEP
jgi:hypothetical protein